ncbi:MAG TPA: hypothetical protein VHI52_07895 [Verrucomicrobiae bacterium]|nr:hypothetical protein [Verrucomicrobiae bacterium]HWB12492.1 hypothetical protein [Pirellulales bacterium]
MSKKPTAGGPRLGNEDELEAAEFCKLLLSRSSLVRIDQPGGNTRLLFDPTTGKTYRIDVSKLDHYVERPFQANAG